jgi:hypothetical protein
MRRERVCAGLVPRQCDDLVQNPVAGASRTSSGEGVVACRLLRTSPRLPCNARRPLNLLPLCTRLALRVFFGISESLILSGW